MLKRFFELTYVILFLPILLQAQVEESDREAPQFSNSRSHAVTITDSDLSRIKESVHAQSTYYVETRPSDTQVQLFELFEKFALQNNLVWIFRYDHKGISEKEKAVRKAQQLQDFIARSKLIQSSENPFKQTIELKLLRYNKALIEPPSAWAALPPLRQILENENRLISEDAKTLTHLQQEDRAATLATVDFSLNPNGLSWSWKLEKPLISKTLVGLPMVHFNTKPYFRKDRPELGGDIHGVSGGLSKRFELNERIDIKNATHYVFYVANLGPEDFYLSIEFFDYDAALDPDKDGFSNQLNHIQERAPGETPSAYQARIRQHAGKIGSEEALLLASGGLVDEYEFQKPRYDGYRFREFAADGPKAQKLRINAPDTGESGIVRVAIPITPEFLQKYFINTGMGDGLFNIGPHDLQGIQYVLYVTEDENLPLEKVEQLSHYKRLLSITEYHNDPTEVPQNTKTQEYMGKNQVIGAVSETSHFVKFTERRNQLLITPVLAK